MCRLSVVFVSVRTYPSLVHFREWTKGFTLFIRGMSHVYCVHILLSVYTRNWETWTVKHTFKFWSRRRVSEKSTRCFTNTLNILSPGFLVLLLLNNPSFLSPHGFFCVLVWIRERKKGFDNSELGKSDQKKIYSFGSSSSECCVHQKNLENLSHQPFRSLFHFLKIVSELTLSSITSHFTSPLIFTHTLRDLVLLPLLVLLLHFFSPPPADTPFFPCEMTSSTHGRRRLQGFLPQLDEFYFTTPAHNLF